MTRERMIAVLCEELERAQGLPANAPAHIADLRAGKIGPGFEAALKAMQRVERECDLDRG